MPDSKTPSDTNHPGHEQASQRESIFAVLGLATLLSTLLIYSAPVITFQTFATWDYFVGIFAETLLFATSIFSFIVILMVLIYRQFSAKVLLPFAAISYLLGVGLFLFLLTTGEENTILIYTAAIICAFGDVSLCLVWGRIFKQFDLKQALINVSAASILSGAVFWILSLISPPLRLVFFAGCALAAAFLPFSFRISNSLKDEKAVQGSEIRKTLSALGSFADFIVMTALGLLFFAFVVGIMRNEFMTSFDIYRTVLILVPLVLIVYAVGGKKKISMRTLHQTFIPLLAIIVLAATSITAFLDISLSALMFLTFFLYIFTAILTLVTLCAIAHAAEFSADLIFSVALFVFALASLVGINVSVGLSEDLVHVVVVITTTIYAFAMVLFSYFKWHQLGQQTEGDEHASQKMSLEKTCAEIAQQFALTAREQEILLYLAKGHNGVYISEMLFISPNTTRTHIHNIYKKLNITSREDILSMAQNHTKE